MAPRRCSPDGLAREAEAVAQWSSSRAPRRIATVAVFAVLLGPHAAVAKPLSPPMTRERAPPQSRSMSFPGSSAFSLC